MARYRIPIVIEVDDADEVEAIATILSRAESLISEGRARRLTPAAERAVATLGRVAVELTRVPLSARLGLPRDAG